MGSVIAAEEARYDAEADILYLVTAEGEVGRSVEVPPGMTVEFDDDGDVIGVEVLRASKVLPEKIVASLHAKQAGII